MSGVADAVRSARNPQEALLAVAVGLDLVLAQLANAPSETDAWGWTGPVFEAEHDEDSGHTEVTIYPVDPQRQQARLDLARQMELDVNFPGIEAEKVYAKGGPIWLYTGNRPFVMSLPFGVRRLLVEDILIDDPVLGAEVARDILKDPDPGDVHSFMDRHPDVIPE